MRAACTRVGCPRTTANPEGLCASHLRTWRYKHDPEYREQRVAGNRERQLDAFGLTVSDYTALRDAQNGVCAICHKTTPRKNLAVDHDHECCPGRSRSCGGCVRGLLCLQCNTKLGWFETNIGAVLDYLGKWSKDTRMEKNTETARLVGEAR